MSKVGMVDKEVDNFLAIRRRPMVAANDTLVDGVGAA
jgi:hypothetical protein